MSDSRVSSFISSLSSQHTDDEQDVQNLKMWKHHSDFWSPGFIKTEQHQTDLDRIKWAQAEVTSLRLELRSATTPRRANRDSIVCYQLSGASHQPARLQRRTSFQMFPVRFLSILSRSSEANLVDNFQQNLREFTNTGPCCLTYYQVILSGSLENNLNYISWPILVYLWPTPACTLSRVPTCMIIIIFVR